MGAEGERLRLRAHAKLNLALRVGARRADGFHALQTVFQTISLADTLWAAPADAPGPQAGGLLHLEVEGATLEADNTVSRAVGLLAQALPAGAHAAGSAGAPDGGGAGPRPVRLRLRKRIPSGAGLGGGSSDGAAALAACALLWGLDVQRLEDNGTLARVAAALGSDVPFFLTGGTALGSGRGERIEPLPSLPATWLVVAAPLLPVATAEAYAELDRGGVAAAAPDPPPYRPVIDPAWMGNDLQGPVTRRWPAVESARRALRDAGGAPALMTGSGSASFGVFADRRRAVRAARTLRSAGLWAAACVTIDAAAHRRTALWSAE